MRAPGKGDHREKEENVGNGISDVSEGRHPPFSPFFEMLFQKTGEPSSKQRPKIKKRRGNGETQKQEENCRQEKAGKFSGNEEKRPDGKKVFRIRRSEQAYSGSKRYEKERGIGKENGGFRESGIRHPQKGMDDPQAEQSRGIDIPYDARSGGSEHPKLDGERGESEKYTYRRKSGELPIHRDYR